LGVRRIGAGRKGRRSLSVSRVLGPEVCVHGPALAEVNEVLWFMVYGLWFRVWG